MPPLHTIVNFLNHLVLWVHIMESTKFNNSCLASHWSWVIGLVLSPILFNHCGFDTGVGLSIIKMMIILLMMWVRISVLMMMVTKRTMNIIIIIIIICICGWLKFHYHGTLNNAYATVQFFSYINLLYFGCVVLLANMVSTRHCLLHVILPFCVNYVCSLFIVIVNNLTLQ